MNVMPRDSMGVYQESTRTSKKDNDAHVRHVSFTNRTKEAGAKQLATSKFSYEVNAAKNSLASVSPPLNRKHNLLAKHANIRQVGVIGPSKVLFE